MERLKKSQFIPFLDVAKDLALKACNWKRIDKSTIFELTMNEQEEETDYICYDNAVTEITGNKPELPQEIATYEGNPCYDFMAKEFFDMPTGESVKTPFLMCFGGTDKRAWRCIATLTSKVLNTVDGKITFSIKLGGDIEKGTYRITDGVPEFIPETDGGVETASAKSTTASTASK